MQTELHKLPLKERLRLVEELWDSIAAEQRQLPVTPEQRQELDRRLAAYAADNDPGRPADEVIADLRKRL